MTLHDTTHNPGYINYGLGMEGMRYGGGWSGGGGHGDSYDYDDGGIYYVAGGSANGITVATPEVFVGGKGWNSGVTTSPGQYGGGAGGYSRSSYTGGSGGSGPGGNGGKGGQLNSAGIYNGCGAGNYGGGVVLLYVAGNLVIDGNILCRGGDGGNGGMNAEAVATTTASGGGGGGGGIYILYGLSCKNTGNLDVSGGSYGNGSIQQKAAVLGTAGTNGTVTITKKQS